MSVYIIVYDLGQPEESTDYTKLIEAIQTKFPKASHFQKSAWIVESFESASQICEELESLLDFNDKILIAPLALHVSWNKKQEEESGDELKSLMRSIPSVYRDVL